jgi:hypothetical protein
MSQEKSEKQKCDSNPVPTVLAIVFFLTTLLFVFLYTMLYLMGRHHAKQRLIPEFDIICPKDKYCAVSDKPINPTSDVVIDKAVSNVEGKDGSLVIFKKL